jgi:hypothetical protein
VSGLALFLATLVLVFKGGELVGPRLGLLSQYFPGYSVTTSGALIGLTYGFLVGFAGGWWIAFLRNAAAFVYTAMVHRRAEFRLLRKLLDYF